MESFAILAIPFATLVGLAALLIRCVGGDDGATSANEPPVIEAPVAQPVTPEQKVVELRDLLERAWVTCENGPPRNDPDGKIALAEVDVAMADSINEVSPEQEQRIRASLGSEMGLAPSQVDGWRDIYRSRRDAARQLLTSVEARERGAQQAACSDLPDLRSKLESARLHR